MDLWPEPERRAGLGVTRACRIERYDGRSCVGSTTLWYSLPDLGGGEPTEPAEPYLIAAIVQAMVEGRTLRVHGPVSAELLDNLTEFRDAWHRCAPETYAAIGLTAEPVALRGSVRRCGTGAVAAYSGGIDSTFTLWRHLRGLAGHRTRAITHAAFVHGFDIPLADTAAFSGALRRGERVLAGVGVPLIPVRTNFRTALPFGWELVYGPALVSCLQQFRPLCGEGLVPSSKSYDVAVFPSGSSVIGDPLLTSASFGVVHDGAGFDRAAKVAEIANWAEGLAALRVCWEGDRKDQNCGECEKCVRSMLNFLSNGLPIPACFNRPPSLEAIRRVPIKSRLALAEWTQIPTAAARNGVRDPWVAVVARKVARHHWREVLRNARDAATMSVPQGVLRALRGVRSLAGTRVVLRPSRLFRRATA